MISADRSTKTDMELVFSGRTLRVPYSTFMGVQQDMTDPVVAQQVADALRDWIYTQTDERVRINKLPRGEPAQDIDPAEEGLFYDGNEIVMRELIIDVKWDGERFQYGSRLPI